MGYKDAEKQKEYLRNHYQKYKSKYRESNKKSKSRILNWFKEYKSTLVCENCGENHPACIEFHHLNPNTKEYNISTLANRGCSKETMFKEISKCKILCANCHRKTHWPLN